MIVVKQLNHDPDISHFERALAAYTEAKAAGADITFEDAFHVYADVARYCQPEAIMPNTVHILTGPEYREHLPSYRRAARLQEAECNAVRGKAYAEGAIRHREPFDPDRTEIPEEFNGPRRQDARYDDSSVDLREARARLRAAEAEIQEDDDLPPFGR